MMVASGGSNGSGRRVGMRFHPTANWSVTTSTPGSLLVTTSAPISSPNFLLFTATRSPGFFGTCTAATVVGSGTWSIAQNLNKVLDFDGVVIGIKREFRYEGGSDSLQNCAWLMQEYEMVDDHPDLVLCALKKSPRFAPTAQTSSTS
ncbi:hypothetical protein ACLB2K_026533 [Fragaria x ananassa]